MEKSKRTEARTEWDMNKRYKESSIKCEFCSEVFNTWKTYHNHAKLAHPEDIKAKWLACSQCKDFLPSKLAMTTHMAKLHSNANLRDSSGRFPCDYCTKSYINMLDFNKHCHKDHLDRIKKDWLPCPDCESCFRNASGLDQHARHRHNKQPKKKKRVYQCSYCPKIFTTPEPMYAHANRYHLREVERDWHFDPVPKLYFPKRPEERRRATDSSIPRIYCEFCSANVTYIYVSHANKLHLEIISKVWLACDDCDQFFPNKNSLNGHKRCKHSKKEDVSGKKSSSDVAKRSFRCQFCQHNFGQAKVLYAHAARDHMELVSKLWHHCQECGLYFPTSASLGYHNGSKHKYASPRKVSKKKTKTMTCNICSETFVSLSKYTKHVNENHQDLVEDENIDEETNSKNFFCEFCSLEFQRFKTYVVHANKIHSDQVSSNWRICSKCDHLHFPGNEHRHFNEESSDGLLRCTFCEDLTCSSQSDFIEHCNCDHLDQISEFWLCCEICFKYFPSKSDLKCHEKKEQHMKRKIGKTDFGEKRKKRKNISSEVENSEILKDMKVGVRSISRRNFEDFQIDDHQTFPIEFDDDSTKIEHSLKRESFQEDLPLSLFKKKKVNLNLQKFEIKVEEEYFNYDEDLEDENFEDDQIDVDDEDQMKDVEDGEQTKEEKEKTENQDFRQLEVTDIPEFWKPPPKVRRKTSKVAESIDNDVLSTDKFDVNKVPLEPDDFETIKINQSPVKIPREITSSGKGGSYGVPNYLKDCIKLVSSVDRNGVETKRVQCEYCPKSHINTSVYFIHVNKDHLEYAMLYWQQCDSCEKYLPNDRTLCKHKLISHQEGWGPRKFLCEFCSSAHTHSGSYYKHMMSKHLDEISKIWIKCKICDTYLPTQAAMDGHVGNLHPSYHKKIMTIKREMSGGLRRRHNIEGYCDFCKARYTSRTTLINHVHEKHVDRIPPNSSCRVECEFCKSSFKSDELYFSHVAAEHQEEAISKHWVGCHFCSSFVPSETVYVVHRANAHPTDSRGAIFRSSDHSRLSDFKRKRIDGGGETADLRLPCHHCLESFTAQGSLNTHMNVKHRAELIQANWDCCPGCKVLVKPNHLKFHIHSCRILNRHSRSDSIECSFCDLCFRTKVKYLNHAHLKHKDQLEAASWITCSKCKRFYPDENTLKVHAYVCGDNGPTEKSDKNKKGLKCPHCPLTLVSKSNLSAHLTQKHREKLNINWVGCSNCDRKFKGEGGLISHQKVCLHPKRKKIKDGVEWSQYRGPSDRQTKCDFCSMSFLYNAKYYKHANLKHPDEVKHHWVQCPDCPLLFPNLTTMRHHLSRTIGKPAYKEDAKNPCDFCDFNCHKRWPLIKHSNENHLEEVKAADWLFCDKCEYFVHNEKYLQRHPCPADKQ